MLRRLECGLLRRNLNTVNEPMRARTASFAFGCVMAIVVVAACAVLAFMRPQPALEGASIVMGQQSGALFVRVGDTWHPVLNLVSAKLIAAANTDPRPVREADLSRTKRGPLLGIAGAPQLLGEPLGAGESGWAICDTGGETPSSTTVVVGSTAGPLSRRLAAEQAILATPGSRTRTYLLYNGRRAVVDMADPAIVRALRLEGVVPRVVSRSLLNAVPEVPPITAPRIPGAGGPGPATLREFPVGSVLRIARADSDEYYVVLRDGVQRISPLAAEMLRLNNSHGARTIVSVAPDVIGASPVVNTLPVATFPDSAPTPAGAEETTICLAWAPAGSGQADLHFSTGGLPVPAGQTPVALAQADGEGPAVDAVYIPPARSAYVRSAGLSGDPTPTDIRYFVGDTGGRFAVHDDEAAHALGLAAAIAAPWPVLATLPEGPELSKQNASVARDVVMATAGRRSPQPP
jgi:type VII secretion protein EccB